MHVVGSPDSLHGPADGRADFAGSRPVDQATPPSRTVLHHSGSSGYHPHGSLLSQVNHNNQMRAEALGAAASRPQREPEHASAGGGSSPGVRRQASGSSVKAGRGGGRAAAKPQARAAGLSQSCRSIGRAAGEEPERPSERAKGAADDSSLGRLLSSVLRIHSASGASPFASPVSSPLGVQSRELLDLRGPAEALRAVWGRGAAADEVEVQCARPMRGASPADDGAESSREEQSSLCRVLSEVDLKLRASRERLDIAAGGEPKSLRASRERLETLAGAALSLSSSTAADEPRPLWMSRERPETASSSSMRESLAASREQLEIFGHLGGEEPAGAGAADCTAKNVLIWCPPSKNKAALAYSKSAPGIPQQAAPGATGARRPMGQQRQPVVRQSSGASAGGGRAAAGSHSDHPKHLSPAKSPEREGRLNHAVSSDSLLAPHAPRDREVAASVRERASRELSARLESSLASKQRQLEAIPTSSIGDAKARLMKLGTGSVRRSSSDDKERRKLAGKDPDRLGLSAREGAFEVHRADESAGCDRPRQPLSVSAMQEIRTLTSQFALSGGVADLGPPSARSGGSGRGRLARQSSASCSLTCGRAGEDRPSAADARGPAASSRRTKSESPQPQRRRADGLAEGGPAARSTPTRQHSYEPRIPAGRSARPQSADEKRAVLVRQLGEAQRRRGAATSGAREAAAT